MTRRATNRLLFAVLITAVGALVALLGGIPEAAILAIPWAVLLVLALSRSGQGTVRATVEIADDRVLVGDEVEVVTSLSHMAGSVHITCLPGEGFWPESVGDGSLRSAEIYDVLVADRATIRCLLPASQWGIHDVGHVSIEVTEPYGLFRWDTTVGEPLLVRVHPTPTELQQLMTPRLVRSVGGAHRSKVVGRGVEYADIRPYSAGDSLREINWQASARSRELWVTQRHPDQATDVILLLDSFVEGGHDMRTVVGLAIEGVVALAESHLSVTDRVGLVEVGGIIRWVTPRTGKLHLQRLVDAVLSTRLYAHVADRDLRLTMLRALPPRSFIVALTPLIDKRFIDALFLLAGHGHDVVVVECDANLSMSDKENMSESLLLAQRLWEADRQILLDRLAEHGVTVARWRRGDHLDLTLGELIRRRRAVRVSHLWR